MIVERLKNKDICLYKTLIDEVFNGSNDVSSYEKYCETNDNYEIIVIKDNDLIIASLTYYKMDLFTFSFQPCLEIFNVAVLKDYRKKGLAKKLFDYVFEYAKNNGYKQVYLTCLSSALPAHRLYESVGFVKNDSFKYSKNIV